MNATHYISALANEVRLECGEPLEGLGLIEWFLAPKPGSFSGIDFAACKQTFTEPTKGVKPAMAGLSIEQSGRYMGLGFRD